MARTASTATSSRSALSALATIDAAFAANSAVGTFAKAFLMEATRDAERAWAEEIPKSPEQPTKQLRTMFFVS
jgi:hypothetical protein